MIRPAQTLSWSWSKARSSLTFGLLGTLLGVLLCGSILGLFIGLLVGQPFFGLLAGLLIGHIFGIIAVSFVGLIAGLIGGLSGKQLTEPLNLAPNEGIWRSAKNGLLVGLISGLISGPIVGLLIGLLVGLLVGLNAFFQHFTLRFWLQQANCMPWNCVAFLDEAAHRSLLYKSGGGYRFIHNLFRDYIASLETPSSGEQKE